MNDQRDRFIKVYSHLKAQLLDDPAFEWDDTSRQWVEWMMDYNVPGGKLNRGFSVVDSYMLLKGVDELTDDDFIEASSLGWCIELFQAASLVLDDIMDNSQTRRGQPCYYRVPRVGLKAINDGQLLGNFVHRILRNQFKGKPYYADLLESLNEVQFQTACGQMVDLITTLEGERDLNIYNLDRHRLIVQYKTAYYSFYLPVASALLLSGENLDSHPDVKNILIDMGIYFQVQDDFLDCYGDPALMGKIGSDIEDFKCSWLIVKALELCDDEQKKLLTDNYGKKDSECVERVKEIYRELNLEAVFDEYENESYEKLCNLIDAHSNEGVQTILRSFLGKIYRRQK